LRAARPRRAIQGFSGAELEGECEMVNRARKGKGLSERAEAASGRTGDASGDREHSPGTDRAARGGASGVQGKAGKTHTTWRDETGALCIGEGCAIVRVPRVGDIEINVRDCDDDVAAEINGRLESGAGADFKMPALKKAKAPPIDVTEGDLERMLKDLDAPARVADLERQLAALKAKGKG